jgi:protein-tyrosine-phosphatase
MISITSTLTGGTARTVSKRRMTAFGMFALGVGYFLWYTPYSALAKAISGGMLPGMDDPIGGLVLLPAHVLGQLLAMPVFVIASGWWRYSRRRRIAGHDVPFPARHTAEAAFWMAIIVLTTTLNFTFPGASIVLMLVLMRIGTLVISPTMDLARRWRIQWYSAAALTLCMVSAVIALTDLSNYTLTIGAILSLGFYCLGYTMRFRVMSAQAKTGDRHLDRRYFIEEHMTTPVIMLALVAVPALINAGPWMHALRIGFTTFFTTPLVIPALLIGVCYEGLYIMTSLIFLDRREFSFCMPVHVTSSLLAGVAASFALNGLFAAPLPSNAQYIAAITVGGAAIMLSYPTLRAYLARRAGQQTTERQLLFVCGGNTSRSPMAAAIARTELAAANGHSQHWHIESAGISVHSPGAPITPEAIAALGELGIVAPLDHQSRQLTPDMCADPEVVYCMTAAHRDTVIALAPDAADRTICLDPGADVPDPAGQPIDAYRDCADHLRTLIRNHLDEHHQHHPQPAQTPGAPNGAPKAAAADVGDPDPTTAGLS